MIIDSRRILGGFAVFALVLMRLVIGWHFFSAGCEKVEYDRHSGDWNMVFSAEGFLGQAKGPLAPLYFAHLPSEHAWREKLASPRENVPPTAEQLKAQADWVKDYKQRVADAKKEQKPAPVEFAPETSTHDWATQIADDWRTAVGHFTAIGSLTDEQKKAAEQALNDRLSGLQSYIADEDGNIAEYRHELWRLANWRKSPEAGSVPFFDQRITTKAAETTGTANGWRQQIKEFDAGLRNDLFAILTPEQKKQEGIDMAAKAAVADPHQHKLDFINTVATYLTLGVGLCLIFGFFTRIASLAGALFVLGVILSQPFWIAESIPTINQCVELSGLLVLAGTGAGRWAGMDGCLGYIFRRRRAYAVEEIIR